MNLANVIALVSAAWQAIVNAPSWVYQAARELAAGWAGAAWATTKRTLLDSQNMAKQLKGIIDAEKANDSRPVDGAADRLQHGSFTRDKPGD